VTELIRADANASGAVDISDAVYSLNHLFSGGSAPPCMDAADSNDDGKVIISDAVFTLGHLYLGAKAPPAPYPGCGADTTPDLLGCGDFPSCR